CSLSWICSFQAEAGIRARNVSGVQACALPISHRPGRRHPPRAPKSEIRTEKPLWAAEPYEFRRIAGAVGWIRSRRTAPRTGGTQIGRASCRERERRRGGAGAQNRNKREQDGRR